MNSLGEYMLTGSCLCNAVQYQVAMNDHVDKMVFCHCQRCRKWSGSAFNSVIPIHSDAFTLLSGQDKLKAFSVNGVNRFFCSQCGSNLFTSRDSMPQFYRLRVGTLNSAIYPQQKIHIYTQFKANWDSICDGGLQFDENIT